MSAPRYDKSDGWHSIVHGQDGLYIDGQRLADLLPDYARLQALEADLQAVVEKLPRGLVVASMCHCDFPDDCDDHWEFYASAEMSRDGEHARRATELTETEMRALVALADRIQHPPALGGSDQQEDRHG